MTTTVPATSTASARIAARHSSHDPERRDRADGRPDEEPATAEEHVAKATERREADAEEAAALTLGVRVLDVAVREMKRRPERDPVVGTERKSGRHARRGDTRPPSADAATRRTRAARARSSRSRTGRARRCPRRARRATIAHERGRARAAQSPRSRAPLLRRARRTSARAARRSSRRRRSRRWPLRFRTRAPRRAVRRRTRRRERATPR